MLTVIFYVLITKCWFFAFNAVLDGQNSLATFSLTSRGLCVILCNYVILTKEYLYHIYFIYECAVLVTLLLSELLLHLIQLHQSSNILMKIK